MNISLLSESALSYANDINALSIIDIVDEQTNLAATENLKIANNYLKFFKNSCEPKRLELREPLDKFLDEKKLYEEKITNWITAQKKLIGAYNLAIMARNNEIADNKPVEQSLIKSEFVKANIKIKHTGLITDKAMFLACILETSDISWINLIFDKVNETQLNNFVKAHELDGITKNYPGLKIEESASVRVS